MVLVLGRRLRYDLARSSHRSMGTAAAGSDAVRIRAGSGAADCVAWDRSGKRGAGRSADARSPVDIWPTTMHGTGVIAEALTPIDRRVRQLAFVTNNKGPSAHEAARIARREARQ
ncbi:hypothetical protein ACV229_32855 [Burkholderia sp. MR1-5-21]